MTELRFPGIEPRAPRALPASPPLRLVFDRDEDLPAPDGFVDIDSAIEEFEENPDNAELMATARREVAESFYSNSHDSVAALRLHNGLSQKQLASILGTSQSHIARIESGQCDPQISTIARLADALGAPLEELTVLILNAMRRR